jgi:hypothetical protein
VRTIETTSHIDAPPEIVWDVITDFAAYPQWNPFITSIEGEAREGAHLRTTFQLAGRRPRTFRPTVKVVEPGRRLVWLGRLLIPGLFDGEHGFALRPAASGTDFVHTERFRGILPPLVGRVLAATHEAFTRMDAALVARAESHARSVSS